MKVLQIIKKNIFWCIFFVFLFLLPLIPIIAKNSFLQHVLILTLLYASMSQAWNIIGGFGGQVSFGHSVFFGIGAYGAAMATVKFQIIPWPGILIGSLIAIIVAILISYPCFKLKGHYFAIATFAIVEIFHRLFMVWYWIEGAIGLDYPLVKEGWKNIVWYETKVPYYYAVLILFILIYSIAWSIERSRLGYYLKAVRESQEAAESIGVNSTLVKLVAMAISAFLTALCGAFFAQYNLRVDPTMVVTLSLSMTFVLITILGGAGTILGPLLGAAILIPLQEYTRALWGGLGGGIDLIIFGIIIVVVVVRQPRGIMGIISEVKNHFQNTKKIDFSLEKTERGE